MKKNHPIFKNKLYFRLKSPVFSIFILPPLLPSSNLTLQGPAEKFGGRKPDVGTYLMERTKEGAEGEDLMGAEEVRPLISIVQVKCPGINNRFKIGIKKHRFAR